MKTLLLFMFVFLSALGAQAAMTASEKFTDPAQQARAETLYREIRCIVCHSQSIDGSDSEMASALRAEVRRNILAGSPDDVILNNLRAHYGDSVLMKPPFRPGTWLLWLMPALLLLSGGLMALRTLRGKS